MKLSTLAGTLIGGLFAVLVAIPLTTFLLDRFGILVDSAKFQQVLIYLTVAWVILLVAALVVVTTCTTIRPVELFVSDGPTTDSSSNLLTEIAAAEKRVCALITRTDKFIQSDVGQPGVDDPSLVADAQQKARDAVGAPITECTDVSEDILQDAAVRITRMEATLKSLTGPELQRTYDNTVPCRESFADTPSLQERLDAVKTTLTTQENRLLRPIDEKQAALQRGEASDCEKRRGAAAGAAAGNAAA